MDLNPEGLGEDDASAGEDEGAAARPEGPPPLLFRSFNFDGAFAMPSFWNNVEIAHRLKVQLKQLHANVDSCMQILLCERRGRKYAFLYATVWFFKL